MSSERAAFCTRGARVVGAATGLETGSAGLTSSSPVEHFGRWAGKANLSQVNKKMKKDTVGVGYSQGNCSSNCNKSGSTHWCFPGFFPCISRRGPALATWDLIICRDKCQICGMSRRRLADEPVLRIRLPSDLGLSSAEITTKPVSKKLVALELQSSCFQASQAHGGESSAEW